MKKSCIFSILFFADRLPPLIGGMETHGQYFIKYFFNHPLFPIVKVITKHSKGEDCLFLKGDLRKIDIYSLANLVKPRFVFFNSGRWIEELINIRKTFPKAVFIYRTGGNEILKAALINNHIAEHSLRQKYWVDTLNNTINLLITNSLFSELRLKNLGISCPFIRCVGGANIQVLQSPKSISNEAITIFCGARFVPYKNHALLLTVINKLIIKGHNIKLKLAGDGPLLSQIKKQVLETGIAPNVKFLGLLNNEENCKEITQADIYMQLSTDYATEVPGGSYIHSEGMGRSILEAITAGTFVIAAKSGALPEIVTNDRGLLVKLDNTEEVTRKISHRLENMPVKLKFCYDYSWEKLFNLYERIFGERI